jgi:hypothetical protein
VCSDQNGGVPPCHPNPSAVPFTDLATFAAYLNFGANASGVGIGTIDYNRIFPVKYSTFDRDAKRRVDSYHYMTIRAAKNNIDLVVVLKESYTSFPSFSTLPHCVVIATTPVMSDDTTTLWQTKLEASFFMATFVPDCRTVVQNRMPAYISPRTNANPCKQSFTLAYLVSPSRGVGNAGARYICPIPDFTPVIGLTELMTNSDVTPRQLIDGISAAPNVTPALSRPVLVEIGVSADVMQTLLNRVKLGGDEYVADPNLYSGLGMDQSGRFSANEYFFGSNRVEVATDVLVPFAFRPWTKDLVGGVPVITPATGVLSALPNNSLTVHDISYGSSTFLSDYVLAVPYDIRGDDVDPARYVPNTGFNRYLTSGYNGRSLPPSFSGLQRHFTGMSNAY